MSSAIRGFSRLCLGVILVSFAVLNGINAARYYLAHSFACKAEDLQAELIQIYTKMDAAGSEEERNLWRPLAEKKFQEAKAHYEKAIKLYPHEPAFQVTNEQLQGYSGLLLYYAGSLPPGDERIPYLANARGLIFDNILRVNNQDVLEAQIAGIYALWAEGKENWERRMEFLRESSYHMARSIELNPGNLEAYDSLIGLYLQLNEPERAGEVAVRKAGYS